MLGSYLPPVLKGIPLLSSPPQMIISLPVQTAVCPVRADGAFAVVVAVQVSIPGLYLAPVSMLSMILLPPQMIISLPVQSAVWPSRFDGALSAPVLIQLLVAGLYLPPVLKG